MNSLVKRELVRELPQMEFTREGLCEACQKEKSKKSSHKGTDTSTITETSLVTSHGFVWPSQYDVYVKEKICSRDLSMTIPSTRGFYSFILRMKLHKW